MWTYAWVKVKRLLGVSSLLSCSTLWGRGIGYKLAFSTAPAARLGVGTWEMAEMPRNYIADNVETPTLCQCRNTYSMRNYWGIHCTKMCLASDRINARSVSSSRGQRNRGIDPRYICVQMQLL